MKKHTLYTLILILTTISITAQKMKRKPSKPFESISDLNSYLKSQESENLFSGVVYVSQNNKTIFQNAYGKSNHKTYKGNDLDTKFNIGSISKVLTKIGIMQLIDKEKINFSDKVVKFIPELSMVMADKITIEHLYRMTSGLGNYWSHDLYLKNFKKLNNLEDYLPVIANETLAFKPGTSKAYSNSGYELLGIIIERVSKQNYYDYIRENIYHKLGMNNSDSYYRNGKTDNLAIGYTAYNKGEQLSMLNPKKIGKDKKLMNVHDRFPPRGTAAGGGYSTIKDFIKLSQGLIDNTLFSKEITDLFFSYLPKRNPNSKILSVAGASYGICSAIYFDYTQNISVIVLTNIDPSTAMRINGRIVESFNKGKI